MSLLAVLGAAEFQRCDGYCCSSFGLRSCQTSAQNKRGKGKSFPHKSPNGLFRAIIEVAPSKRLLHHEIRHTRSLQPTYVTKATLNRRHMVSP